MKPLRAVLARFVVGIAFGIALAFLLLPLLALVLHTTPGDLVAGLRSPVVLDAIRLSLITTLGTLLLTLAFGLPAAWVLARWRVPGRGLIEAALALPMVLPPVVAGVALLVTVGARGTMGPALHAIGLRLPFTTLAVVLARCHGGAWIGGAALLRKSQTKGKVGRGERSGSGPGGRE